MSYVRNQYIGTLGCFTSPRLCGKGLNRFKGLSQCSLHLKRFRNIAKVTFTWETRVPWGNPGASLTRLTAGKDRHPFIQLAAPPPPKGRGFRRFANSEGN